MSLEESSKQLYNSITNLSEEMAKSYMTKSFHFLLKEATDKFDKGKTNQKFFDQLQQEQKEQIDQRELKEKHEKTKESNIVLAKDSKSMTTEFRSKSISHNKSKTIIKPKPKQPQRQMKTKPQQQGHRLSLQASKTNINLKIKLPQAVLERSQSWNKVDFCSEENNITNSNSNYNKDNSITFIHNNSKNTSYNTNNNNSYFIKNFNKQESNSYYTKKSNNDNNVFSYSIETIQDNSNTQDNSIIRTTSKLSQYHSSKSPSAYYEKEKKFQQMKKRRMLNLQNIKAEKEQMNYKPKPEINEKSKEIMSNKTENYIPVYQRAIQLHRIKQTKKSINQKITEDKMMSYIPIEKKSKPKIAIDSFIADQFEWKEKIMTERKIKKELNYIKKEIEIDDVLDQEISKRSQYKTNYTTNNTNNTNNKKVSRSITTPVNQSVYQRLYLDQEIKKNRLKLYQEKMKPSFKPEINKEKQSHSFISNKRIHIKKPIKNKILRSFNEKNTLVKETNSNRHIMKSISGNSRNKNRNIQKTYQTHVFSKRKPIQTNWVFESESSSHCFRNININEIKGSEPSWLNELELVSSAPTSNDCYWSNENNDSKVINKKAYKLNTDVKVCNEPPSQKILVDSINKFNSISQ